tara:strand:- start:2899 stop:3207 length:309 start_codon:yes stop_codon:yes gene_type:complete
MWNILMRKTDLKTIYFNIYMTYTNSYQTLEEVGTKYDISKQRVWQIVRFCVLGKGDYYKGLKLYNETYRNYQEKFADADLKTLNALMRDWMKSKNIRLIKTK